MENNETPGALSLEAESQVASIRAKRRRGFNWIWVIAPLMLIVGIGIGYFGRPLLSPTPAASGNPPVIDLIVAQTRHFKGNANAPIMMLEFSDFQ